MSLSRVVLFVIVVLGFGSHFAFSAEVAPASNELPLLAGHDLQTKINNAKGPLVLDFWAVWCGPCQVFSPIVSDVSQGYQGKMEFYKVDVSDKSNDPVVQDNSIQAIPTLLVFERGRVVERWEGIFKKTDLKKRLDKVLHNWVKSSQK